MDDYDYSGYDYSEPDYAYGSDMETPNYWNYGEEPAMYGSDVENPIDWSQYGEEPAMYGSDIETPIDWSQVEDKEPAMYGSDIETPIDWSQVEDKNPSMWGKLLSGAGTAFTGKWNKNPVGMLAALANIGGGLYGSYQGNKALKASAGRNAAELEARKARFNAPITKYSLNRQASPTGDLTTFGRSPGSGRSFFSPGQYTPMAEGGRPEDKGWLSRIAESLSRRRVDPSMTGTGMMGRATNAAANRAYQLYRVTQEMDEQPTMSYEEWVARGRAHGGSAPYSPMRDGSRVFGDGGGQDDTVSAALSDGEYVFSAQDVSDFGDGSNDEGARKLDEMRRLVRQHAGRKNTGDIAPKQPPVTDYANSMFRE